MDNRALPLLPLYSRCDVYALMARFLIEEGHNDAAAQVLASARARQVSPTDLSSLSQGQLAGHLAAVMHQLSWQRIDTPAAEPANIRGMLESAGPLQELLGSTSHHPDSTPANQNALHHMPLHNHQAILPRTDIMQPVARAPIPAALSAAYPATLPVVPGSGTGPQQNLGAVSATPYQPMSPLPELPAPSPELAPQDMQRMSENHASQQTPPQDQEQSSDPEPQLEPGPVATIQQQHLQQQQQQQQQQQRSVTNCVGVGMHVLPAVVASQTLSAPARMGMPTRLSGETVMPVGMPCASVPCANSAVTGGSVQGACVGSESMCLPLPVRQTDGDVPTRNGNRGGLQRPMPPSPNHSHNMQHSMNMSIMPGGIGSHVSGGGSVVADVSLIGMVHATASTDGAQGAGVGGQPAPCGLGQELDLAPHSHRLDAHLASLSPHHVLSHTLPASADAAAQLTMQVAAVQYELLRNQLILANQSHRHTVLHPGTLHTGSNRHRLNSNPSHSHAFVDFAMVPDLPMQAGPLRSGGALHTQSIIQHPSNADEGGAILDLIRDNDDSDDTDDIDNLETDVGPEVRSQRVVASHALVRVPVDFRHLQAAQQQRVTEIIAACALPASAEQPLEPGTNGGMYGSAAAMASVGGGDHRGEPHLHLLPLCTQRSGQEEGVSIHDALVEPRSAGLGSSREEDEGEGLRADDVRHVHPDLSSPAELLAAGVLTPGLEYVTSSLRHGDEDDEVEGEGEGEGEGRSDEDNPVTGAGDDNGDLAARGSGNGVSLCDSGAMGAIKPQLSAGSRSNCAEEELAWDTSSGSLAGSSRAGDSVAGTGSTRSSPKGSGGFDAVAVSTQHEAPTPHAACVHSGAWKARELTQRGAEPNGSMEAMDARPTDTHKTRNATSLTFNRQSSTGEDHIDRDCSQDGIGQPAQARQRAPYISSSRTADRRPALPQYTSAEQRLNHQRHDGSTVRGSVMREQRDMSCPQDGTQRGRSAGGDVPNLGNRDDGHRQLSSMGRDRDKARHFADVPELGRRLDRGRGRENERERQSDRYDQENRSRLRGRSRDLPSRGGTGSVGHNHRSDDVARSPRAGSDQDTRAFRRRPSRLQEGTGSRGDGRKSSDAHRRSPTWLPEGLDACKSSSHGDALHRELSTPAGRNTLRHAASAPVSLHRQRASDPRSHRSPSPSETAGARATHGVADNAARADMRSHQHSRVCRAPSAGANSAYDGGTPVNAVNNGAPHSSSAQQIRAAAHPVGRPPIFMTGRGVMHAAIQHSPHPDNSQQADLDGQDGASSPAWRDANGRTRRHETRRADSGGGAGLPREAGDCGSDRLTRSSRAEHGGHHSGDARLSPAMHGNHNRDTRASGRGGGGGLVGADWCSARVDLRHIKSHREIERDRGCERRCEHEVCPDSVSERRMCHVTDAGPNCERGPRSQKIREREAGSPHADSQTYAREDRSRLHKRPRL